MLLLVLLLRLRLRRRLLLLLRHLGLLDCRLLYHRLIVHNSLWWCRCIRHSVRLSCL